MEHLTQIPNNWNLPNSVYDYHFHPQTFGDKFAVGMVEFFKLFNKVFFRDKVKSFTLTKKDLSLSSTHIMQ